MCSTAGRGTASVDWLVMGDCEPIGVFPWRFGMLTSLGGEREAFPNGVCGGTVWPVVLLGGTAVRDKRQRIRKSKLRGPSFEHTENAPACPDSSAAAVGLAHRRPRSRVAARMPTPIQLPPGIYDDEHLSAVCSCVVRALDAGEVGVALVALGQYRSTYVYVSEKAAELLGHREDQSLLGTSPDFCRSGARPSSPGLGGAALVTWPLRYSVTLASGGDRITTLEVVEHRVRAGSEDLALLVLSRSRVDDSLSTARARAALLLDRWLMLLPTPSFLMSGPTVRNVNAAFREMVGLPPHAGFSELRLADLVHSEDLPALEQAIGDVEGNRIEYRALDVHLQSPQGSTHTLELKLSKPFGVDSEELLGLGRDITDRRTAERHALRVDRLAALGLLAGGIAHSINNPLTYVFLNLEHVCHHLAAGLHDETDMAEFGLRIAEAQQGADRMAAVVKRMRAFARDDDSSPSPVDLREVLDATLELVGNEIRHRADLFLRCAGTPKVHAVRTRLEQAFLNLLLCAAQSLPEGSREHCTVSITAHEQGERLFCDVVYHPAPNLDALLDAFSLGKLAESLDPVHVGISVCEHILASMGGALSLVAAPGPAAVFRVELPVSAQSEAPLSLVPAPSSIPPSRPHHGRILVVDDDPAVGRALRLMLQDDHEVSFHDNPRAALRTLLSDPTYDVVFCDLMMPELSGSDLYHAVRLNRPGQERKFVFMTGGAFTAEAAQFLARVPNRRIDKPFTVDALQNLVRRAIGKRPSHA